MRIPIAAALALLLAAPAAHAQGEETAVPDLLHDYYDWMWFDLAEGPENHFKAAALARSDLRPGAAAAEIRRGSTFLKIEAHRAQPEQRGGLMDAYRSLRLLADQIEGGEGVGPARLDREFRAAHLELADHHLAQARSRWSARQQAPEQEPDAGALARHLEAAIGHLRDASNWSPDRVTVPAETGLDRAAQVLRRIRGDGEWSPDELDQAFQAVERSLMGYQGSAG